MLGRLFSLNVFSYLGFIACLFALQSVSALADDLPPTLNNGDDISGLLELGAEQGYRFSLAELSRVVIYLGSSDFDTVLDLHGPNFTQSYDDIFQENTNSRIDTLLEPGDYHIEVRSFENAGGGEYRLLANFEPLNGELTNAEPIELGETLSGIQTANTHNLYSLTVVERSDFTIDVTSDDFDTNVTLVGNGILFSNDDTGDYTNSRIETLLEPGTYTIQVSASIYDDGGEFTIQVNHPTQINQPTALKLRDVVYGDLIEGQLLTYRLVVDYPTNVTINATSDNVDTVLTLSNEALYLEDDDGDTSLNSRIKRFLHPGEYFIQVRNTDENTAGTFRLELDHDDLLPEIVPGKALPIYLPANSNRVYGLNIIERSRVSIDASSDDLDTLLKLSGNDLHLFDDDGGDGTNSRIDTVLEPGAYLIEVSAYSDEQDDGGIFTILVEQQADSRNSDTIDIAPGESLVGIFNDNNLYNLIIEERSKVTIDVASNDFDAVTRLTGNGINIRNDYSGYESDSHDSHIEVLLEPGNYRIQVDDSWDDRDGHSGIFTLQVQAGPEIISRSQDGGDVVPGDIVFGHVPWSKQLPYRLIVDQAGIVSISATAETINPWLALNGNGVNLEDNDSGIGDNSLIEHFLTPGEYTLEMGDYGADDSGIARLTISNDDAWPEIVTNETLSGILNDNSVYRLTIDERSVVSIYAASDDFDTRITLVGDGVNISSDNYDRNDAQINALLEPGAYSIRISTLLYDNGIYTLLVQAEAGSRQDSGDVRPGDRILTQKPEGQSLTYRLIVDHPSSVSIKTTSSEGSPRLTLDGQGLYLIGWELYSDRGNSSQLEQLLEPGEYIIQVQNYGDNTADIVRMEIDQDDQWPEVIPGKILKGTLPAFPERDSVYSLVIDERSEVTIDVTSDEFDTLVTLLGNDINLINNDNGDDSNSRISTVLESGIYIIQVRADHGDRGGLFNLKVVQSRSLNGSHDNGNLLPEGAD